MPQMHFEFSKKQKKKGRQGAKKGQRVKQSAPTRPTEAKQSEHKKRVCREKRKKGFLVVIVEWSLSLSDEEEGGFRDRDLPSFQSCPLKKRPSFLSHHMLMLN